MSRQWKDKEVFYHRVVTIDGRILIEIETSHRNNNNKEVFQEKYWQTIMNKFAAPNSSIRAWRNCKYKTIDLCRQRIETRKDITSMHFLSVNPKVGLPATVNDHEDDPNYNIINLSLWKKTSWIMQERSKTPRRHLENLQKRLVTKLKRAQSDL